MSTRLQLERHGLNCSSPRTCHLNWGKPLNLSALHKEGVITPASQGDLQDGMI